MRSSLDSKSSLEVLCWNFYSFASLLVVVRVKGEL